MSTSIATFAPRARLGLPVLGASSGATLFAGLALLIGAAAIGQAISPRQAALYLLGGALGLVLYHAAFGFTSAWRVFIADRRGAGLRAQMVMLALATALFFPVLAAGSLFGQPVQGLVAPIGISVWSAPSSSASACSSAAAAPPARSIRSAAADADALTLAFFIVGSTLGAAHFHWWTGLPTPAPTSLVKLWGPWTALAFSLVLFAAIAALTVVLERRRHGALDGDSRRRARGSRALPAVPGRSSPARSRSRSSTSRRSPSPGGPGASPRPSRSGARRSPTAIGIEAGAGPIGRRRRAAPSSKGSVLNDVTSVMDVGIMLGALLAAGLAGRFAPAWRVPLRSAPAAVIGGLLLGYGARLAYGCNIGAYFSGIASGSVHGWVWLVFAFVGNVIGTYLRPLFGLEVERTPKLTGC